MRHHKPEMVQQVLMAPLRALDDVIQPSRNVAMTHGRRIVPPQRFRKHEGGMKNDEEDGQMQEMAF